MASTPQTQAVQVANGLIAAANTLMQLYQTINALDAQWTDDGVAATLAAMQTMALNTDGSLGSADGMDIQRIKTALLRSALDNSYLHNAPRPVVSEAGAGPNTID